MRAVRLGGPRQASVCEVTDPVPQRHEVLVRIHGCGVCGSDLNAWRGVPGIEYPLTPGTPGHETFGEVVALGPDVKALQIGEMVSGLLWNGFAELGVAHAAHLVPVPRPLLGEPLACASNVVRRAGVEPGQRVAIVGFGYLAALIVQLLPNDVGGWIAVSRREDSRALARRLGAEAAYDYADVPSTAWDSFDVVIEAAGVQRTLDVATWLTAYGSRLVVAGYHADGPRTVNMQSWNWKGIDVINAHDRAPEAYVRGLRDALTLVAQRHLDLDSLVSHRWPLERTTDAFEALETRPPGFTKGIVEP
jgi:threonine dehydrogenase-like Zn-dependent dehydrogenase